MTVEVKLHDFCGDVCPWFELEQNPTIRLNSGTIVLGGFTCEHYQLCESIAERIKTQKVETHDA